MTTPLMNSGWIAFNEQKWGLTAHKFQVGTNDPSSLSVEAVLYSNARGKLRSAPHNIFCPVSFSPTSTLHPKRIAQQWLDSSSKLAQQMQEVGLGGAVSLDLPVPDARAWQWRGFRVEVLYTYMLALPFDPHLASSAVRRAISKASRLGYSCERTEDLDAVMACVTATESRQGFTHRLSSSDLATLRSLMGEDHCRAYLCRAPTGEPASGEVVLHQPGATAIDWIAGTGANHLVTRSRQCLLNFILEDLVAVGATRFNLGGANIPSIAASKAEWGGQLTTYYSIEAMDLRTLAKDGRDWTTSRVRRRVENNESNF